MRALVSLSPHLSPVFPQPAGYSVHGEWSVLNSGLGQRAPLCCACEPVSEPVWEFVLKPPMMLPMSACWEKVASCLIISPPKGIDARDAQHVYLLNAQHAVPEVNGALRFMPP